ncbi:MAG: tyrosine-type recombinase/integrase [Planctomycetaceae bacterium]|nr:tyrosine-type recombinase/integrase [Planctomycetaceae bacterium]MDZ4779901.1 tyrosine-type recombinase/integrase [Planctomycetia bacterium]MDZ4856160.1 tyrosine-type recombinase/integrase [Nitrospirota bacterium]
MHLVEPTGRKLKWDIRFRNHDGKIVRVPGDRKEPAARAIGERIEMLVKAKAAGDPPPAILSTWIANLQSEFAARLSELGLIPSAQIERSKGMDELVRLWREVVRGRNNNGSDHADQQAGKAERVVRAVGAVDFRGFDPDTVTEKINGFKIESRKVKKPISMTTRRSYGIAIKDFTCWLSKKLKLADPLADMPLPSPTADIEYERQPLTVKEFRSLMAYLDSFETYNCQRSRWTAQDRKLIYLTAVNTAYRQKELRRLRVYNLYFDEKPAVVALKARDAKNKRKGELPIGVELAMLLKRHVAKLEPDDPIFPFPATRGAVMDMLRLDLAGAGVPLKLPGGEVRDFHTFRSTAITWWLDVYGLKPKRVQLLARLSDLRMVSNYSRNMRIEDFGWLDEGPTLVPAALACKAR